MKNVLLSLAMFTVLGGSLIKAQEPKTPVAQKEHKFLKRFTGKWISTVKSDANADLEGGQSPELVSGTMDSQMLGDFWVINRLSGDAGGTSFKAVQTIGYDTKKQKFVGTWVDTMMNHLWHYEGQVDVSGNKLSLFAEGPSIMDESKLARYRDSYEFKSHDEIITTSEMKGDDGKWFTMMTAIMQRAE